VQWGRRCDRRNEGGRGRVEAWWEQVEAAGEAGDGEQRAEGEVIRPPQPGADGAVPDAPEGNRTLDDFIAAAARQLKAAGWKISRCRGGRDAPWHLAAHKGDRWRVVQVLAPATAPADRQQERIRLGQAARLSGRTGTMEQWLGHVRPGGHVTFGHDVLTGAVWGGVDTPEELQLRFGHPAQGESVDTTGAPGAPGSSAPPAGRAG
jgi:hypothetical protein